LLRNVGNPTERCASCSVLDQNRCAPFEIQSISAVEEKFREIQRLKCHPSRFGSVAENIAVLHATTLATGFDRIQIHLAAGYYTLHAGEPRPDITSALQL
jgi:hypothetical protein